MTNLPMSASRKSELQSATSNGVTLQSAITFTMSGWPRYQRDVPESLKKFYNVRNLLSVSNGLLTYTDRIVVPTALRGDILKKIHEGHQGVTKCLERVRASVWWPGITQDVKRLFTNCEHCQVHKPCQRREPLIPTPLPSGPWQKVAIDLCHFRRQNFLIVID